MPFVPACRQVELKGNVKMKNERDERGILSAAQCAYMEAHRALYLICTHKYVELGRIPGSPSERMGNAVH